MIDEWEERKFELEMRLCEVTNTHKRQLIQERVACLGKKIEAAKLGRPKRYPEEEIQEAFESSRSKSRLHEVLI